MANTWIVVANASMARIFENTGPNKGLSLLKELNHPPSRQKNAELASDRPGTMGTGGIGGTMKPQTSPKEHEARVFAQEVVAALYHGRATNAYHRMVLVAPPTFMGLINSTLDDPTANLVTVRVEKDYTKSTEAELIKRLAGSVLL